MTSLQPIAQNAVLTTDGMESLFAPDRAQPLNGLDPVPAFSYAGGIADEAVGRVVMTLYSQLDEANEELKLAHALLGHLRDEILAQEERLRTLPKWRARATRTILLEIEVDELRRKLADANQLIKQTRRPWWHWLKTTVLGR